MHVVIFFNFHIGFREFLLLSIIKFVPPRLHAVRIRVGRECVRLTEDGPGPYLTDVVSQYSLQHLIYTLVTP